MKKIILFSIALIVLISFNSVNAQNQKPASAPPLSQIDKKDQRAMDGTFKEHRKNSRKGHHKKHHGHHKGNGNVAPHQ